jgi:SNF2 family DNA or RNA helicase
MTIKAEKQWQQQVQRLQEMALIEPQLPSTFQGELRDYQLEGYQWLCRLAHWGAGACLADDMGLGKTVQALALILARASEGATLILAPTSVCMNWLEETQRFAPTLRIQQFGGGDRQQMLDNAQAFDVLVCSYGLLQTEGERLASKHWQTIVADEAQAIKNGLTKRSKAVMALPANFRLITTGTPIENHLGELWNLFNFINPGLLGSLQKFNTQYAGPIENNKDHGVQLRLKKLLRPFILRRLKTDVLTELPARTEVTLHIELSAEEQAFYEALRRDAVETMQEAKKNSALGMGQQHLKVLAEIMKLRRACCHPRLVMENSGLGSSKLEAFAELVEELISNRHKALVFSQFVGHLTIIRELLDRKKIHYQYLDGSTPVAKRTQAVNAFQAGEGDLFLISLKAGGSGLNLTAADYVIHMDPWWNPAVEDQASDRAHRMGQQRPVTIYRLVAKDTIEDKIVALHKHKRDLAHNLLEGGELSGKMSVDEILALISDAD